MLCCVLCYVLTQELYVLMRIHHVLCERLGKAVTLAEDAKALKSMQVSIAQLSFGACVCCWQVIIPLSLELVILLL